MSNGQIVPKEDRLTQFKRSITSQKAIDAIQNALPEHINPQKMARVVITAVTRTPKLLECNPMTVMNAVIEASQLGLMPDSVLGHGYLVPYKKTCVFIPGYKGMLDLARRSGELAWVQARIVYENDDFKYEYGMEPTLTHTPARALGKEPGKFKAAYGIAKYKTGEFHFEVMHQDEIEKIRQRSRAGNDGPWVTDYDEMARKTVIRRLCKFLPMNPEYQNLVARDEYHEAGVLGQYLDVDPATGEVLGDKEPPSTGDMLDLFADQLEGEDEPEIPDPRFEESGQDDDPPKGDGDVDEDGEAPPPVAPVEESDDVPPSEPEDEPDAGEADDSGQSTLLDQGQGRISKQEDASFAAAVENLRERMRKVQDNEMIERVFANRLNMFGAKKYLDIRQRLDREKFYRELLFMCEQWESMPPKTDD
jgi:recombination protein RecT